MNIINKLRKNFPRTVFGTCIILLVLSLFFKAYDMVAVSCIGVIGSFVVFVNLCYLDKKYEREMAAYEASLRERGKQKVERDCQYLEMLDKPVNEG